MPVFQYKALTAKGDATQGVVDADTPKEAREKLRGRNIFVTEMAAVESKKKQEKLQKGGLDLTGGNALQAARQTDKQIKQAKGLDPNSSEAIVIADTTTPYRLLIEVLFTLGQSEYGKYHLMVLSGAKK